MWVQGLLLRVQLGVRQSMQGQARFRLQAVDPLVQLQELP